MKKFLIFFFSFILGGILLIGCGGGSSNSSASSSSTSEAPKLNKTLTVSYDETPSTNFPSDMSAAKNVGFKFIIQLKPIASKNQDTIRIVAMDDGLNGEKIKKAAFVFSSLLSDLEDSTKVGFAKRTLVENMAKRQATLFVSTSKEQARINSFNIYSQMAIDLNIMATILNHNDLKADFAAIYPTDLKAINEKLKSLSEQKNETYQNELIKKVTANKNTPLWLKNSQDLYFDEMSLEGDCNYMTNFDTSICNAGRGRDGSIEEILHIVQAQGIATTPLTKSLQSKIQVHAKNIFDSNSSIWKVTQKGWDDWLKDDINPEIGPTYSHEYYAAVAESYYGIWRHKNKGLDDYISVIRSDIIKNDPKGDTYVKEFVPPYHTYTARVQSNSVKSYYDRFNKVAVFKMSLSTDKDEKYTYKSQYLTNVKIVGNSRIDVEGNAQTNFIEGNEKDNVIDGKEGVDVYIVNGNKSDYTISTQNNKYHVIYGSDIGNDLLKNMEYIKFNDITHKL